MNIRRFLVALITLTALASTVPTWSASAERPQQVDGSEPTPVEPVGPGVDGQGVEIIHSWALTPATSAETGSGNRIRLSYTADPGIVLEDAVTLYNLGNVPLVFRIYATDAFNNPDGGFDLLGAEEVPTGAGSWVDFGAEQITVDAQTQVTIPVTISIPPNATPGDHVGALLASSSALSTGEDGQQITVDRRTGTRLYVRVNGPLAPEVTIENLQTDYSATLNPLDGSATVTYTIENRGNTVAGATVTASVSGPFGLGKQTATPRELPDIIPGQSITFTEQFEGVPALGVAIGEVELTPTGENSAEISASSSRSMTLAFPIAVLLGLLLILFAVLAARAIRRHQARDSAAAPADELEELPADREPEHQPT